MKVPVAYDCLASLLAVDTDSVELQAEHERGVAGARYMLPGMTHDGGFGARLSEADLANLGPRQATGERTPIQGIRHQWCEGAPGQVIPVLESPMWRQLGRRKSFQLRHRLTPRFAGTIKF